MPTLTATTAPVSSPSTSLKFRNVSNSSPVSQFALLSEPVHEWIDSRQPVLYYPFQSVNRIVYQQTAAARLPLPQSNLPTHQFGQTVRHTAAPAGHHRHSLKSSAASATITSSRHRKGRVQQQSTHQHRSNHNHYNPQTVHTTGNGMSSSQSTTRTDDDLAMGATSNATDGCTPKSADFDEDLNSGPIVELVNGNGSASGTIEQSNGTGSGSNSSASSSTGRKRPTCRETVMLTKHVFEWSVDEVGSWLTLNHLEAYIELFCQQHRIDGRVLVNLSPEDLRAEPLALTVFGDIKRFCLAIGAIRDYYQVSEQHSRVRQSHEHSSTHRMVKSASGPSLRQQQQRNHVQYQTFVKHPQQQQQQPNLYSAAASSDSHFRNGQQSQHQRRSGNSKLSQSRAGGYSQLGKNANYRSQSASLFTSLQHEQQLPLDDSTEDDYDRGPEIMYDEEDDGEDDIDEVVIPQDREAAFFGAPEPQYVLSTNFQPYMPEGSEAGHHQPMSSTALYNSTRKRASVSDSGSLSDSSMSSDDSRDGSSASSSVSFTSVSKSESTALDSSSFPSVAKPIPINVYVPSHGASSNGRQIQAQIIPTVTSASQLANMAAYYSTAHQQQAYLRASQAGAPLHYNQAGSSSAYPSHFSNGSRMPPPTTTTTTTKKSHKKRNHSTHHYRHGHHGHHRKAEFKPEAWKAIVAMLYFLGSTWVTAIVMVIVHDRVPDMDTYPPLPDILLDNLPLIPWAFGMCEFCGLVLFIIWSTILIFHKHRFILLRRMFSLFGSVFLLRCITMLITSLSVPGRHLECKARPYGSWLERINQAYLIWQGGGMSIQGVRTCGDYMFSGHTVVLTLMNFFITEYTPTKYYLVHTLSWVLNLFGIFFILSAHEHYSIDVFIAFYISTRLFLYYHTLANNRALYQRDRHRTRIWFPLFYFFESSVNGIVPNQYEVPFRKLKERLIAFVAAKFAARLVFGVPGIAHRQSMTPAQQQMNDEQGKLLTGDQKSASGTAKRTSSTASSSSQRSTSSVGNGQTVNHSSTKVKTQ